MASFFLKDVLAAQQEFSSEDNEAKEKQHGEWRFATWHPAQGACAWRGTAA
jgi:hypothetical protein